MVCVVCPAACFISTFSCDNQRLCFSVLLWIDTFLFELLIHAAVASFHFLLQIFLSAVKAIPVGIDIGEFTWSGLTDFGFWATGAQDLAQRAARQVVSTWIPVRYGPEPSSPAYTGAGVMLNMPPSCRRANPAPRGYRFSRNAKDPAVFSLIVETS